MIASIVFFLTLPYWASLLIYAFLRTFAIAPSGIVAWASVVLLSLTSVWGWRMFFLEHYRKSKLSRSRKLGADRGDQDAVDRYLAEQLRPFPVWTHATGFMAMQLLIPVAVSLVFWSDIRANPLPVKVGAKVRLERPQESLHRVLSNLEKRGIFTPLTDRG